MQATTDTFGFTGRSLELDSLADVVENGTRADGDVLTSQSGIWTNRPVLGDLTKGPNEFLTTDSLSNLQFTAFNESANFTGNAVSTPLELSHTGVTAGTYGAATITVDVFGRVDAAANVSTDASLAGVGTPGTPLILNVQHGTSLVGNGSAAVPLHINIQSDLTLQGNGQFATPLALSSNYVLFDQIQSMTSGSETTIFANALNASAKFRNGHFGTGTPSFNVGTGIWTCVLPGVYSFRMSCIGAAGGTYRKARIRVTTASPSATDFQIGAGDLNTQNPTTFNANLGNWGCAAVYEMDAGDTMRFTGQQDTGGSISPDCICSIVYHGVGAPS